MRPSQALLLTGGRAGWAFPGAVLDMDFAHGRAAVNGRPASLNALFSNSNASGGYVQTAGGLFVSVGANLPRISDKGLLIEQSSTNIGLRARDFTNASWTKTTCTAALDQTGADGAASAASSLTATAGNATALQSVTHASAASTISFSIKRITGSGTIQITLDGGTTLTDVTSQINSSGYTTVSATQTVTNPNFGIKIVTNGDKIAVDFAQLEIASFATSPIVTTSASASRNADAATLSSIASGLFSTTFPLSVYAKGISDPSNTTATAALIGFSDGSTNNRYLLNLNGTATPAMVADTAVAGTLHGATTATTTTPGATFMTAAAFNTNDCAVSMNGGTVATGATLAQPTGINTYQLGANGAASNQLNGYLARLAIFSNQRLTNAMLQALAAR